MDFRGFAIEEIAIQVARLMILARADLQTIRIDDGAQKPISSIIEEAFTYEREYRGGRGGFITVNARRDVNARSGPGRVFSERQQWPRVGLTELLFAKAVFFRQQGEVVEEWGDLAGRINNRRRIHGVIYSRLGTVE